MTANTAPKVPLDALTELCRRYRRPGGLAVFGSALRDDFRAESDIDFLVEFQPEAAVGFVTLGRLQPRPRSAVRPPRRSRPEARAEAVLAGEALAGREILYAA